MQIERVQTPLIAVKEPIGGSSLCDRVSSFFQRCCDCFCCISSNESEMQNSRNYRSYGRDREDCFWVEQVASGMCMSKY